MAPPRPGNPSLAWAAVLTIGSLACQRLNELESESSYSYDTEGRRYDVGPSGGDPIPTYDCRPGVVVDCPGGKCTPLLSGRWRNVYQCVDEEGDRETYAPCVPQPETGIDGCPVGAACIPDDREGGLCLPLCRSDGDCDNGVCVEDLIDQVEYCGVECDPLQPMCPPGTMCRQADDRFVCGMRLSGDTGTTGHGCSISPPSGCTEGFVCATGGVVPACESTNCCTPVCDVGAAGCPSATACAELFPAPAPGFERYGACTIPQ